MLDRFGFTKATSSEPPYIYDLRTAGRIPLRASLSRDKRAMLGEILKSPKLTAPNLVELLRRTDMVPSSDSSFEHISMNVWKHTRAKGLIPTLAKYQDQVVLANYGGLRYRLPKDLNDIRNVLVSYGIWETQWRGFVYQGDILWDAKTTNFLLRTIPEKGGVYRCGFFGANLWFQGDFHGGEKGCESFLRFMKDVTRYQVDWKLSSVGGPHPNYSLRTLFLICLPSVATPEEDAFISQEFFAGSDGDAYGRLRAMNPTL